MRERKLNERDHEVGSVMLLALVIMVVLTLLGLSATRESIFESKMVGNQRRLNEDFLNAEIALISGIRGFRSIATFPQISEVLNDTMNTSHHLVSSTNSIGMANLELRRIYIPTSDIPATVAALTLQANSVPSLSHRYYDGSIDKKRFAITSTAIRDGASTNIWVQKGISVPAEQDRDMF